MFRLEKIQLKQNEEAGSTSSKSKGMEMEETHSFSLEIHSNKSFEREALLPEGPSSTSLAAELSKQPAPLELANTVPVGTARLETHRHFHPRLLGTKATAQHWRHESPCTQKPPQYLLANNNWKGPIIYHPALQRELHSEAIGSLLNKAKCVPEGLRWEERSLFSHAVGYIMGMNTKNQKSHAFS